MLRIIAIWISGLLASGIATACIALAIIDPEYNRFFPTMWGFICGASAFACARLWLADPERNSN